MLKRITLWALALAAVAVAYSLVKTMGSDGGASVDVGLVATLAVTGALAGVVASRKPKP